MIRLRPPRGPLRGGDRPGASHLLRHARGGRRPRGGARRAEDRQGRLLRRLVRLLRRPGVRRPPRRPAALAGARRRLPAPRHRPGVRRSRRGDLARPAAGVRAPPGLRRGSARGADADGRQRPRAPGRRPRARHGREPHPRADRRDVARDGRPVGVREPHGLPRPAWPRSTRSRRATARRCCGWWPRARSTRPPRPCAASPKRSTSRSPATTTRSCGIRPRRVAVRREQLAQTRAAQPAGRFAPFSATVWTCARLRGRDGVPALARCERSRPAGSTDRAVPGRADARDQRRPRQHHRVVGRAASSPPASRARRSWRCTTRSTSRRWRPDGLRRAARAPLHPHARRRRHELRRAGRRGARRRPLPADGGTRCDRRRRLRGRDGRRRDPALVAQLQRQRPRPARRALELHGHAPGPLPLPGARGSRATCRSAGRATWRLGTGAVRARPADRTRAGTCARAGTCDGRSHAPRSPARSTAAACAPRFSRREPPRAQPRAARAPAAAARGPTCRSPTRSSTSSGSRRRRRCRPTTGCGRAWRASTRTSSGAMLTEREVVRMTLMRGTVHLVTVRDALLLRPLVQVAAVRGHNGAFGRRMGGADPAELAAARARDPRRRAADRARARRAGSSSAASATTSRRSPTPPASTSRSCRCRRAACGAPAATRSTRRSRRGPAATLEAEPSVDDVVLRYLRAFGPGVGDGRAELVGPDEAGARCSSGCGRGS